MTDLKISNYNPENLFPILKEAGLFAEEYDANPLINMLSAGLIKAKLHFEFSSIRKIGRMYKEAAKIDMNVKPNKYISKNMLKNKIEFRVSNKKIGGAYVEIKFLSENQIQRIVKVMQKTA